eukprot:11167203-Lingulodinium_polyedra.AAC.1
MRVGMANVEAATDRLRSSLIQVEDNAALRGATASLCSEFWAAFHSEAGQMSTHFSRGEQRADTGAGGAG